MLFIVFNKKPDLLKKGGSDADQTKTSVEIFNREEIRKINNAHTECPFNKDQLEKFFALEKLEKVCGKINTYLIDVNEK